MLLTKRHFLQAAVAALATGSVVGHGQSDPTFTSSVKVVNILASVKNKKGELKPDLDKADFEVFENGRSESIRYFARQSDLPLTLGLLIDTSMSQDRVLDAERAACFRFLDQVLRPRQDKVFVMQFDSRIILRQELTDSWKDLNESLSMVATPSRSQLSNDIGTGTRVYDTVVEASRIMQPLTGRKALIILSDGVDTDSDSSIQAGVDAALKSDTLVYSILFSDEGYYAGHMGQGSHHLEKMSADTGGSFFAVSKRSGIQDIFDRIQSELRGQYNIGYISGTATDIPEFRKLEVKVKEKGLNVQTRSRYWATP